MINAMDLQNRHPLLRSFSHIRHPPISPSNKDFQNIINMPLLEEDPLFTGRPETHNFAGILFDMDGTIVDSTDAIVKHWHKCDLLGGALCAWCMVHISLLFVE